ncbi:struthiocalcin-2-like [Dermochelys coriacea]|uniref:struthiocalcin-2-like n=1 Tax=Dermochelys coriacea TaxID=27794 RepID=UPI001CA8BAF1|nr:struthiocalcin-2-like [Dermochelys coriacea]
MTAMDTSPRRQPGEGLSEEEHNAVAGFIAHSQHHDDDEGDNVWIGLYIPTWRRRWSWTDISELDFDAWDSHRSYSFPSLKMECCVALEEGTGFMTWVNDFCKDRNTFVCKYRP